MFSAIGRFVVRRPRQVIVVALIFTIAAMAFGVSTITNLKPGGFVPKDAESRRAAEFLTDRFGAGEANMVLTLSSARGADAPEVRIVADDITARLRSEPEVSAINSYWALPAAAAAPLRSEDGRTALITAHVAGGDNAPKRAAELADEYNGSVSGVEISVGGPAVATGQTDNQVAADLIVAEMISVPITAVLLIMIFGSLIAALLPLIVGVVGTATTLALLGGLAMVTDVSVFAMNLTTALALALAVDYSLFIVSRYREELDKGAEVQAAVIRTVSTAGRTVVYSGLTVALSMTALLVFPQYFLKSFAYAGVAVVSAAVVASVVVLPAALALLGHRVNMWDVRAYARRRLRGESATARARVRRSRWFRAAAFAMRHAVATTLVVVGLLLFLGSTFLSVRLASVDDRMLNDTSASSRQVGERLRSGFAEDMSSVVVAALPGYRSGVAGLAQYARELSQVDGVTRVVSSEGVFAGGNRVGPGRADMSRGDDAYLLIGSDTELHSAPNVAQFDRITGIEAPARVLFAGAASENRDILAALRGKLPLALTLIAVATLILLFLFTGSVVIPVKALVMNMLSLSATFGAMVWIFQEGHLSGFLGFTPTGYLFLPIPVLMFCLAFGMSMDYEVFLLSRIREEWLRGNRSHRANLLAIANGLDRTGGIITAVAAVMAVVFAAMVTANVAFIQLLGFGLMLAVLVDATIIRGFLVPAVMAMFGRWNWWAPRSLVRLHDRIGFSEN
ncbi:MMPL family transporter [Nocardia sp. NPDC052566]|uniref:MMPL family transporter n=1 Tax=Nocardia sp. NPDC052566 TaxID=3364330 RepID=UPI0037CC140F